MAFLSFFFQRSYAGGGFSKFVLRHEVSSGFVAKVFLQEKLPVEAEDFNNERGNESSDSRSRKTAPLAALLELGDLIQQKRQEQRSKKTQNLSQHDRRIKLEEWRYEQESYLAGMLEAVLTF